MALQAETLEERQSLGAAENLAGYGIHGCGGPPPEGSEAAASVGLNGG
jgi:hypothetical protein